MNTPEGVCWLLPVRDTARFLPDCLASIAAQTVRKGWVLAWDNGSRDASIDILRKWIPARLPGRVVIDQPFGQLGDCLRQMVEETDADILARIDADDVNLPHRLEVQLAELDSRPELVAVGGQTVPIDSSGHRAGEGYSRPLDPREVRFALLFTNPIAHPTVMMRRSAVLEAGNYRAMSFGQDYDLWYRLTSVGPVANVPDVVLQRREHSAAVSAYSRRHWRELHLGLLSAYRESVVPGVREEDCRRVWECVSTLGTGAACDAAAGEILMRMGRAASRPPVWQNEDFLATGYFRRCYRRCARRGWLTYLRRFQLCLHGLRR